MSNKLLTLLELCSGLLVHLLVVVGGATCHECIGVAWVNSQRIPASASLASKSE